MAGIASKLGTAAKSSLVREGGKEALGNLYTGKSLSRGVGAAIALGGLATAGARIGGASTDPHMNDAAYFNEPDNLSFKSRVRSTAPAPQEMTSAPSILAGGQAPSVGQADNMGATGDMVFGMHNKRHG